MLPIQKELDLELWKKHLMADPYLSYLYAYPHKTAYRELDPPLSLPELWEKEQGESFFCICIFLFVQCAADSAIYSHCLTVVMMYMSSMLRLWNDKPASGHRSSVIVPLHGLQSAGAHRPY